MPARKPSSPLVLAVIAYGVFVAADDLTVVSTMLRQIIFDLEIPLPEGLDRAAWIVNGYLIAYVVVMPFVGRLSDVLGRRSVYIGALILFLLGSIWVPFASTLNSFIFGRVLTALGGGAMVPVGMAIIGDLYRPGKRATAMGTLGAVDTAGWVWGPLYGALLIRFLSWRWQFYLNVPLSLAGIAAAWWALADLPRPVKRARIDWLGTALLSVALLSLNVALLSSGDLQSAGGFADLDGNQAGNATLLYIIAGVAFILFILAERSLGKRRIDVSASEDSQRPPRIAPLIDLTMFRRSNFTAAILINFLIGAILIIAMVNVPLIINVLEVDAGQAAITSGYLLSAMTASMAIMAFIGGRLTERMGYRLVMLLGTGFCAVGFALMGNGWVIDTPYGEMAWQLVILGMGFGLVTAPLATAVINAARETERGIASSLVIVMRLIGMSVGLSGLTAWGLERFGRLRVQIELPDLPLSDPIYQKAIVDGLMNVTVQVLAETFLISAVIALSALFVSLKLGRDQVQSNLTSETPQVPS